jgi:hypothetical protein
MQILTTSVLDNQQNVYRDVTIKVTFDEEVNNTALTNSNFILYNVVNNAVTTQHSIVIKKNTSEPKILEISPVIDLSANADYMLFIKGDSNINDTIIQGVVSINNTTMSGNYVIKFRTGSLFDDNDVIDPGIHPSPDGGDSDTVVPSTSGTIYNRIIRTNPYSGEANVKSLQSIIVEFANELNGVTFPITVNVENATWPFEEVPELYQPSGFVINSITISGNAKTVYVNIPSEYINLPDNTLYQCIISANSVTNLSSDYAWLFFSRFNPAYAHPRQIRARTGTQFIDVPDALIWFLIHENSRYIDSHLGVHYNSNSEVPEYVNRWIVCKTAMDLYEQVFGVAITGVNGSIIQKTLGDLTIKYDSASSGKKSNSVVPDSIIECVNSLWLKIIGGSGQHCVKSRQTSHYPGRTRSRF